MMNLVLEDTAPSQGAVAPQCAGCLIKIHPLEVDAGVVKISAGDFTIGRDEVCRLTLRDDSVSRCHAKIELLGAAYHVTDLGSTNGVYVNEELVQRRELRAGDRLRIGNQIFKFLDEIEAQYHETAYEMLTRDGLTRAYNKRYFLEALDRSVQRCRRRRLPMSLVLFDIDHFKRINDTFGHLAGDEVLQELSARVMRIARDDELFARFGGEEFAVLICDGKLTEAVQFAERCRSLVSSTPFETSAEAIAVSISGGVAEYDLESSAEELVARADQKLYQAKRAGRNQICS